MVEPAAPKHRHSIKPGESVLINRVSLISGAHLVYNNSVKKQQHVYGVLKRGLLYYITTPFT